MPVWGYKEAFGLSDNPFGPRRRLGAVPAPLTADLEKKPLFLHKNNELETLYCDKIPSFRDACDHMGTILDAAGYEEADPGNGVASYLIVVEGDRGAGKTTLASRLIQLMLKRYPKGEPARGAEEVLLNSSRETVTEQVDRLKELEIPGVPAAYRCVLIDDLLADAYPFAEVLYDKLIAASPVFMVLTSWDPRMSEQIEKTLHTVRRFPISPLTADDAIAYVRLRYNRFRIPTANGLNAEPLFPFDEQDIRMAVSVKVLPGVANTGPVNLRLVGSVLSALLDNRLNDIRAATPEFDVKGLPHAELTNMKIKVAQAYETVVRP